MSLPGHRRLDQRGIAQSTPLALLSAAAVVLAGVAFLATNGSRDAETTQVSAPSATSAAPTPVPPASTASKPVIKKKKHPKPPVVKRGETFVEVFNNSGISGLAGSTAARAEGAGWQVVGSDNWYGTIGASTVYYPSGKLPAAKLLAKDLGIGRIRPAIAPMRFDRLTVILTADYS